MALSPNYSWAEPDNSSLVKNGAQDIRALGDAIDTSVWNIGFGQAGKNKIINGDFGIWQRSTSATVTSETYLAPDRYRSTYVAGGATVTWSRQSFTAGAAPVAGYEAEYFSRISATSGSGTTVIGINQPIEDVRTFAGQTATISFWAKADSARTATILILQNFGSGGSGSVTVLNTTQVLTTSWVRYSFTVAVPSISGKTIGTGSFLVPYIYYNTAQASGSPQLDTWGLQFEYGSKATPFETATGTIQGELDACMRYFQRRINSSAAPEETVATAQCVSTTQSYGEMQWMVPMRVNPSVSVSAATDYQQRNASAGVLTLTAISFDRISQRGCRFITTVSAGLVAGDASLVAAVFANNATLDASAEL
jgi:hypothetical protein